jgi:hypothetical protein
MPSMYRLVCAVRLHVANLLTFHNKLQRLQPWFWWLLYGRVNNVVSFYDMDLTQGNMHELRGNLIACINVNRYINFLGKHSMWVLFGTSLSNTYI